MFGPLLSAVGGRVGDAVGGALQAQIVKVAEDQNLTLTESAVRRIERRVRAKLLELDRIERGHDPWFWPVVALGFGAGIVLVFSAKSS